MAVSATQLTSASSSTAITTCNFTAQSSGVWLVLCVSADDYRATSGTNRPESSGWTLQASGEDFLGFYVWTKVSTGSENTVDYKIGSAVSSAWEIIAVTGADSTLDNTPSATHTHGGNDTPTPSVTPSAGNRYALAVCGAMHSTNDFTGVSAWTNSYGAIGFQLGPASGSREITAAAGLATSAGTATSSTATWSGTSCLCSYGSLLVFAETSGGSDATATPATVAAATAVPAVTVDTNTVTFISQGAAVSGTTSITTAAYGAGWADGDLGVCAIASNHATVEATEPTMPAGWDKIDTLNGGGGTQGTGTGNRRLTFFTRTLATGDDTTPTVSLSTGNVMIAAISVFRKASTGTWSTAVSAFGAETTAGTGWSEAMTTDPGFDAGDMLLAACAVRDTSTTSAEGFSATGATFSALTEQVDSTSETGNDISLHVSTSAVTAGPSSAAGTRTATHSTSETGVMGVLRLRATASSGNATVTPTTVAGVATVPAATVTATKTATVTPTAVVSVGSVGSPTVVTSGNATVTPLAVVAAAAVLAAVVSTGTTVTPTKVSAVAAVPAATMHTGVTVTPATVAAVAAVPAVTGAVAETVTPAAVSAIGAVPAASVLTAGNATASPATVAAVAAMPAATLHTGATVTSVVVATVATVPAPTVLTAGNANVTPATAAAVAAVPAAILSTGSTVTPIRVIATAGVGSPSVQTAGNATVIPGSVAGVAGVSTPTVTTTSNATVTTAKVSAVAAVPAPTIVAGANVTVSPAAVTTVAGVPTPGLSITATVTPAAVASVTAVPAPNLHAGSTVAAARVAATVAVPAVTVTATSAGDGTAVGDPRLTITTTQGTIELTTTQGTIELTTTQGTIELTGATP